MKKFMGLLFSGLLMLSLAACSNEENPSPSQKSELNILTWEGYVPEEVVKAFEEETGISVNYSSVTDNESMFSKLQAANGGEYDILICSDYIIPIMVEEGNLLKALDKEKIPNYNNIEPGYLNRYYDPENQYAIAYAPAIALLAYDSDVIDFEVTGYADLWREELTDSVVLLDGDRDVIGIALQTLGYSVNETDEDKLEEVKDLLLELKANVIAFSVDRPHEILTSGEAKMGYMFGSHIAAAMEAKDSIKYVYPQEGLGLYVDNVVMAANAPNEENAYIFLDYILDGKNSAAISDLINYTNCNIAAKDFLSEEFKANGAVNLPSEEILRAENYTDVGAARTLYSKIWTEFKSY